MKNGSRRILIAVIVVGLLVASVWVARWYVQSNQKSDSDIASGKIFGPPDAPITIVEFSDFECPSCAKSQLILKKLIEQFPGLIQIQFRQFPLSMHTHAMEASKFSECAAEQGKFWFYQELLFQERASWSRDPDVATLFRAYANAGKLNRAQYERCLKDPKIAGGIEKDRELGLSLQVGSTPTFFINGERLVGSQQLEQRGAELIEKFLAMALDSKGIRQNVQGK